VENLNANRPVRQYQKLGHNNQNLADHQKNLTKSNQDF
jgi:hypothetical protein